MSRSTDLDRARLFAKENTLAGKTASDDSGLATPFRPPVVIGLSFSNSNDYFEDFFENGAVAMHWVGPDGVILRANRCELEMLGYEPQEYVGRHIAEFHVSQDAIAEILERLSRREVLRNHEAQLRCKDGSIRDVAICSSVLWDGDRFHHTRCLTLDITDRKRLQASESVLVTELAHRVRNTLTMVQAIANQTLRSAPATELSEFSGRLRALGGANDALVQGNWESATLGALVSAAIAPFEIGRVGRITISGPDVTLDAAKALSLTLVIHELATNAAKYGALSEADGRISLEWELQQDHVAIRWKESGGPRVSPPTRKGFGSRLLESVLAGDQGSFESHFYPDGFVWILRIPCGARK